jgi:hypothetical protein
MDLHTLWCLKCQNKNLSYTFTLISLVFVFSSFFSKCEAWSSSFHVHLHHHGPLTCSTTWIGPPYLIHTIISKVSPRLHQLSKTKLGLSIFPFLVIDGNLFIKIFNENFRDSCCLPKKTFRIHVACPSILPYVKVMDKFYKPELVVLAPHTYVLRV